MYSRLSVDMDQIIDSTGSVWPSPVSMAKPRWMPSTSLRARSSPMGVLSMTTAPVRWNSSHLDQTPSAVLLGIVPINGTPPS